MQDTTTFILPSRHTIITKGSGSCLLSWRLNLIKFSWIKAFLEKSVGINRKSIVLWEAAVGVWKNNSMQLTFVVQLAWVLLLKPQWNSHYLQIIYHIHTLIHIVEKNQWKIIIICKHPPLKGIIQTSQDSLTPTDHTHLHTHRHTQENTTHISQQYHHTQCTHNINI